MSDDLLSIAANKEAPPPSKIPTPINAKKPLGETPIFESFDEYNYIPAFSQSDKNIFT